MPKNTTPALSSSRFLRLATQGGALAGLSTLPSSLEAAVVAANGVFPLTP